jgi:hypothetical protein
MRLEELKDKLRDSQQPYARRFHTLMARRVRTILMVSTPYESFSLSWDGSLAEDIYGSYSLLHLQNVPQITTVTSGAEALAALNRGETCDLVLVSSNLADMDMDAFAGAVKQARPGLPVVALVFAGAGFAAAHDPTRYPNVDYLFSWQGNTKVLLSIIKLIEDRLNVDKDITVTRIGVILVVEDSIKQYSFFLPTLYTILMKQAFARVPFGVDENERQLFTRTRPKVLLARTFAEADALFDRYQPFLHGIISDLRVSAEEREHPLRGRDFLARAAGALPGLPMLLISADEDAPAVAAGFGIPFADKKSPLFMKGLEDFCISELGFGDFVFRDETGREFGRVRTLGEMARALRQAPGDMVAYLASRNKFSHWFLAQGETSLAQVIRPFQLRDFGSIEDLRGFLLTAVDIVRREKRRGIIATFRPEEADADHGFLVTGRGSLGGKGRGLAFMFHLLNRRLKDNRIAGVEVRFPRTLVITTDSFDEFMTRNDLYAFAVDCPDDRALRRRFLRARLPDALVRDLRAYLGQVRFPLAIRSSSHMEDSSHQPFAGLYETYMLPNSSPDDTLRLGRLTEAIKMVYASAYTLSIKRYFQTLRLNLDEEKMAVIVQELVGRSYGELFYPAVSGVAQSFNYYPFARMEPGDGVATVALGLGKTVVDGGNALRFCPRHPNLTPHAATPAELLQTSQRRFYALDLGHQEADWFAEAGATLSLHGLDRAERDTTLNWAGSVIAAGEDRVVDDLGRPGERVVTFAPILRHGAFPLCPILNGLLELGKESMGSEVELEFAANLDDAPSRDPEFYLLQIRPMVTSRERSLVEGEPLEPERALCLCTRVMGNGLIEDVRDLVYCHPARFRFDRTRETAETIARLNQALLDAGRRYVLIGPGRWGTRIPSLGVPVNWQQVAGAALIVETEAPGKRLDASQGAHFFHNLAATGIGYFSIPATDADNLVRWDRLEELPAEAEEGGVRHVRTTLPFRILMDALGHRGAVMLPEPG